MIDKRKIKFALEEIQEAINKKDYEAAHSLEDDLFIEVLKTIALGFENIEAYELADEALKSLDIDFPRWCA